MLDITTNQGANINSAAYCGYGIGDEAAAAAELLLDEEMMDPLFEEDWLHENNLDILFDLFEEEIENKIGAETNSASSTLFGTSPVTSYLFGTSPVTSYALGTSPSLASALDLIYFDNQQPTTSTATVPTNTSLSSASMTAAPTNAAQTLTSSIRIKRGLKKGQSEGVSLLAKPCLGNSRKKNGSNSTRNTNSTSSKNIDINRKQKGREKYYLHKCQQHVHYTTGRAVMHEHAYAIRGH